MKAPGTVYRSLAFCVRHRVPADPDDVFSWIGRDAWVPVVGPAVADAHRFVPAVAVRTAGEDIRLPVSESLPHKPGTATLIRGHEVPDIRPRSLGQAYFLA